jgi:predicted GNAT family acetyltransferase
MPDVEVVNNEHENRYELKVGDATAVANYQLRGNSIVFTHTEVPDELEGQGIGTSLARAALDDARKRDLVVVPLCPFIREFIETNPDYKDLVEVSEASGS